MTFQKMTNDLIAYRMGAIDERELDRRRPTWKVKAADVKYCVNAAINAGKSK